MIVCYMCGHSVSLAFTRVLRNGNSVTTYYCKQDDPTRKIIRNSTPDTEVNIEINNDSEEFAENIRKEFVEKSLKS